MKTISRKEFLAVSQRFLTLAGLVAVFGPVVSYFFPANLEETPSDPVNIGKEGELPLGSSKTIQYGRYPALIIHTPEGLRAFSAVCTHFACIVKWDPEKGEIVCPCHDGFFDPLDGHVVSGPPPTSLDALPVEIVDGEIYVGGAS